MPLLEELYLPAFTVRNRQEAESFVLVLKSPTLAQRLKVLPFHMVSGGLHLHRFSGGPHVKEDWEFSRCPMGLDTEGPGDEPVFPKLERLALSDIHWMSLGASLLAGKLPKLKRIEPITSSWPSHENVYEQGKGTWQYWVKEILASRPSLCPWGKKHTIKKISDSESFTTKDFLVDFSKLDKHSNIATSIRAIDFYL